MNKTQGILLSLDDNCIQNWFDAFLLDRKIKSVFKGSTRFYNQKLGAFVDWCQQQGINQITEMPPIL